MPFCFLIQNFAEIGQSVDELWPKTQFSRWRPPPSWILKFSIFDHVTVIGFNMWCSVPSFIEIGRFFTEIWRFNDFQNDGRPPSWILKICSVCHVWCSPCRHAVLLPHTQFRWNRTIGRRIMAKKFSRLRPSPSWVLKISIFGHVTAIGFNICCSVPSFIKIGWFFTEIWWFSGLQNGGRPPSWICYDVRILHRRTHFRCLNIVLKFHVDRCCSFRDTCNIIGQPFWLYIRDHGNFGVAHALYLEMQDEIFHFEIFKNFLKILKYFKTPFWNISWNF